MQIRTARLILRPLADADLEDLVALHADPQVTRFVRALGREQAISWLAQAQQHWRQHGYGPMAIYERRTARFLGWSGLKLWPQFGEIEVGWILRKDAWGSGYATEAGRACLDWGFARLDVSYITAMIQPANTASIRVTERLALAPIRDDALLGDAVRVYAKHRDR